MAHEYIISESNEEDIYISVCIYHFAFGYVFPFTHFSPRFLAIFFPLTNFSLKQLGRLCPSFGLVNI